jgi:outer membrane protein TolC
MNVPRASIDIPTCGRDVSRGSHLPTRRSPHPLLLAAALLLIGPSCSTARAQGLDETLDWTLRTNVSIRSDDARQDAVVSRLKGSIDAFMPSVSFVQERILESKISYSPDIVVPTASGVDSIARREPNLYGFQATLPLFDGMRRYNNFRAARIGVEAGKFLQIEKRQQVLLDAATAYLAILRDRRIVELRRKQVLDISTIAQRTKTRFDTRDATLTDVDIANSRVLAAQVALEQSRADLEASNIEFTRITGQEPRNLMQPAVPNALLPKSVAELKASLMQSNPRVQAARLDAIGADYAATAQVAEVLPQVNLVGIHARQSNISDALSRATDSTLKIQMRVPLYEPGAYPRIGEARAVARQKSWDAIDSEKQSTAAATTLFLGRASLISQIGQSSARVRTMKKAVEGYQVEQTNGLRVVIDILNARNELTAAQVEHANLEFLRDRQTFTLAAALARLGPPAQSTVFRVAQVGHPNSDLKP